MLLRYFSFVLSIACFAASVGLADQPSDLVRQVEQSRIQAIAKAMPSAVSVFVPGGAGGGSGVLISPDGYALTNFHVTSPAGEFMRCGLSDGKIYDAVIVGIDPVGDLAMIKLLGRDDFPYADFANSLAAQPGDWCMAIGNPFLLATNLQPTVTWGILSGVRRYQYPSGTLLEYGDCFQTDASINPGNSGGPLYDATGDVLGIIGRCSFEKRGRVNVGVGYAISIRQAANFLGYLHGGRIVDHATLGATVSTDPDEGVIVTNILSNSDAYRRGLRFDSEILEVDGRPVVTANDLQNVMATLPANWRIKLSFVQNGETVDTLVRLSSVHQEDELLVKMASALPPPPPQAPPKKKTPDEEKGKADDDGPAESEETETVGPVVNDQLPDSVAKLIKRRRGYANFHFNEVQVHDFAQRLRGPLQGRPTSGTTWKVTGTTADDVPRKVEILVNKKRASMLVGEAAYELETATDRFDAIERQRESALLIALESWRSMIDLGPSKFGETFYMGTMPLGGQRPLRDCVVGLRDENETRWLSHPVSKELEVVEVFTDRDSDPAELWLSEIGDDGMPQKLDLRYGIDSVLQVNVTDWQITGASK